MQPRLLFCLTLSVFLGSNLFCLLHIWWNKVLLSFDTCETEMIFGITWEQREILSEGAFVTLLAYHIVEMHLITLLWSYQAFLAIINIEY